MHILLLNDDRVPTAKGGSALVVEWERQELVRRGHTVTLVTTHQDTSVGNRTEHANDYGKIISLFVEYPLQERHRRCLKIPSVSAALDALFLELQPDIVHAHTIHTYLTYDALRVAARHAKQVFMTAHDTFAVSFGRVNSERYRNDALAHRPHRLHVADHVRAVGRQYWPLRNAGIRNAIRESDTTVIAISDALREFLETNGVRCGAVVHNGVPLSEVQNAPHSPQPTILYGGRINADKGIGALLSAMELVLQKVPHAQLMIVGEKDRLQPHLQQASPMVQQSVRSPGWQSYKHMRSLYAAADVVTTPSVYLDAFNLMNIEAMQAGKPVVGTCFGGTPEIVLDGATGVVRNPLDTQEYAKALITLLEQPSLAQQMGAAGKQRVQEHFSIERHVDNITVLFESAL